MHRDHAVAERLGRDQVEATIARQSVLIHGGAVARDHGVDEEPVLIDQAESIELCRKFAAPGPPPSFGPDAL